MFSPSALRFVSLLALIPFSAAAPPPFQERVLTAVQCGGAQVRDSQTPHEACLDTMALIVPPARPGIDSPSLELPPPPPPPPAPGRLAPVPWLQSKSPFGAALPGSATAPGWTSSPTYTYTTPRCQIKVSVSFDKPPDVETLRIHPFADPATYPFLQSRARFISNFCVLNRKWARGQDDIKTWLPGPEGANAGMTATWHVAVQIFGGVSDPALVHWLASRRKPAWMTDERWQQEMLLKMSEYVNYSNESVVYP